MGQQFRQRGLLHLPLPADDHPQIRSKFVQRLPADAAGWECTGDHTILAAAAVSEVDVHSAVLMLYDGKVLKNHYPKGLRR